MIDEIQRQLVSLSNSEDGLFLQRFFKTGPGQYGEGDRFRGIRVPELRRLSIAHQAISLAQAERLLHSAYCDVSFMAFADTLGACATVINLQTGFGTATIESKTNFFAPAAVGTKVTGECTALDRGRRTMAWQTRITSESGKLIAVITQTQMVLEPRSSA